MTLVKWPTISRAARFLIAASTMILALSLAPSAQATNVNLRVETLSGTVFNGPVNASGGTVKTTADSNGCSDDASPGVNYPAANSVTALAGWADASGVAYNTTFGGGFICKIGATVGDKNDYWLVKINNKTQNPPGTYIDGTTPLNDGDSVLWYFTDSFAKPTLALSLPPVVQVGTTVSGSIARYDSLDDSKSTPAGVSIDGDGASTTSSADGGFSIAFPAVGVYTVSATFAGAIRASAVVNVTAEPAPLIPLKINRFVKCADAHKKGSRKYTRCIRIVRAKQLAAKRQK
jgi:hypothetical protein